MMESTTNYGFKNQNFSNENSTLFATNLSWATNHQLQNKVSVTYFEEQTTIISSITNNSIKKITSTKRTPTATSQSKVYLSNIKNSEKTQIMTSSASKKPFLKDSPLFKHGYSPALYPQEYYFIVFIIIYLPRQGIYRCTGSLLSSRWVLTAGYCLSHATIFARNVLVVAHKGNVQKYLQQRFKISIDKELSFNDENIQERRVVLFKIHPKFDPVRLYHDVALLKLKQPFKGEMFYGELSKTKMVQIHTNCKIVGFGLFHYSYSTIDGVLRNLTNLTVSTPDIGCENPLFPDIFQKQGPYLCFTYYEPRVCPGEFGVPLICEGKIWGIATKHEKDAVTIYDHSCHFHDNDEYFYSAMFININWIQTTMNKAIMSRKTEKKWILGLLCFFLFDL